MVRIHWPRSSVFSALAQIKASTVMIIDCQESDINLTTTGLVGCRERNVFLTLISYHTSQWTVWNFTNKHRAVFCSSLTDRPDRAWAWARGPANK